VLIALSRRAEAGLIVGVVVFAGLFLAAVGQPRSLRFTTLTTAWLLYLLLDAMFRRFPRPDAPPMGEIGLLHLIGMPTLLFAGVLNDPLFALNAPPVLFGLFLTGKRLPWWYWALLLAVTAFGLSGIWHTYGDSGWWLFSSELAKANNLQVPFLIADGWRNPVRWFDLFTLVGNQFTIAGLLLGVIGLARLSRWYPPVGVVTIAAYTPYALFGLVYFGADASVLLLPLLMIQIVWMTYAMTALGQWLGKLELHLPQTARARAHALVRWAVPALFSLLPLVLLARIAGLA
jgi:hypothetical protein